MVAKVERTALEALVVAELELLNSKEKALLSPEELRKTDVFKHREEALRAYNATKQPTVKESAPAPCHSVGSLTWEELL